MKFKNLEIKTFTMAPPSGQFCPCFIIYCRWNEFSDLFIEVSLNRMEKKQKGNTERKKEIIEKTLRKKEEREKIPEKKNQDISLH